MIHRLSATLAASLLAFAPFPQAKAQSSAAALGIFEGHSDVGATRQPGSASYTPGAGKYLVAGGGANMWSTNDAFHFVWKKVSGDFSLTADISFVGSGGNPHKKACLILRQSLDPDSVYADAALHGVGLTALQYRATKGGITQQIQSNASAPKRLRIEKHGNSVSMSIAGAGEELLPIQGSVQLTLTTPFYVGLAVCAHDDAASESALFSNVEIK